MPDQVSRQEHLQKLHSFCCGLDKALAQAGLLPEISREAWRAAVAARCVRCDIEVSGEELFALSMPPSAELASAKIGRLRLGDCARKGCASYYYRLTFKPYLDLNWAEILAQAETIGEQPEVPTPSKTTRNNRGLLIFSRFPTACRISGVFLLVLLLLIVRQWYVGGRIPLLREPERFQVDPQSTSSDAAH